MLDRRTHGETDVFSRRLYTLKGQQTFDDIQRKYKLDADFHAAVNRYTELRTQADFGLPRRSSHGAPSCRMPEGLSDAGARRRSAVIRAKPRQAGFAGAFKSELQMNAFRWCCPSSGRFRQSRR
jgi:hypothetical protein